LAQEFAGVELCHMIGSGVSRLGNAVPDLNYLFLTEVLPGPAEIISLICM